MLFLLFLVVVVVNVGHRNLTLNFGQNKVSNSWDIVVFDAIVVVVVNFIVVVVDPGTYL